MTAGDTETASHIVGRERLPRVWTLTLATGPGTGAQCVLRAGGSAVLGRASDAFSDPAFLADSRLSREHLLVRVTSCGALTVQDMGSRNGSFLNAERFEHGELRESEILGLGRTLVLAEPGEPTWSSAAPEAGPAASVSYAVALAAIQRGVDRGTPLVLSGPTGVGKGALIEWVTAGRDRAHWRPGEPVPAQRAACLTIEQIERHAPETFRDLQRRLAHDDAPLLVVTTGLSLSAFLSGAPVPHALASRLGAGFVAVPPLRERRADIPLLAMGLVRDHDPDGTLDPELVFRLLAYDWPGNLYQLQGVVEHAIVASGGASVITLPPDLDALLGGEASPAPLPAGARGQPLTVAEHGVHFVWGDCESPTYAATSPVARVLWALSRRRAAGSLEPVDPEVLVNEVWPEETLVRRSGRNRLYVALSTLRKAGLADILERAPAGYRLSPRVEVVVE